jgi:hypothetical protein
LIPNSQTPGAYDWGTAYASRPIFLPDETRLYYGGGHLGHFDLERNDSLCLATLRPHGFAGYEPINGGSPAVVTTRPVAVGSTLGITADAAGGSVTVSLLAENDTVLLTSVPVTADVTASPLAWAGGSLQDIGEQEVRLRFEIVAAKVYAFHL